jgi:imidazolonepropionase-like amidohydrolase
MMRTVFSGGRVFDGTGAPIADGDVVVEDGRIVEIGAGLDGDDAVDCGGRTILPGLFDCHVHVMISHIDLWALAQTPFSYRFYQAAQNLRSTIDAGITTVRDAGGADLGVKVAVDDGLVTGPRMHVSLTMISQTGGHGDGWMASGACFHILMVHPGCPSPIVDGPEQMRHKVRELARNGADVIKVATSGGVLSPRDKPHHAHLSMEELEVLVAEATAAHLFVMAHAQAAEGIKNAVRAGIRSIEHGIYLDDEAIGMMLESGTYLVPTLVAPAGVVAAAGAGASIPEASLIKAKEVVEVHRESVTRAIEAGVKVAMGTDSGVTAHGDNLAELPLMARCGMSPEEALVATTHTAAELMGLDEELGTLEPGKRGDLVLVKGDPLDLDRLRDGIDAVYKDGVRV